MLWGNLKVGVKFLLQHRMPVKACDRNFKNTGDYFAYNMKNMLKIYNIEKYGFSRPC